MKDRKPYTTKSGNTIFIEFNKPITKDIWDYLTYDEALQERRMMEADLVAVLRTIEQFEPVDPRGCQLEVTKVRKMLDEMVHGLEFCITGLERSLICKTRHQGVQSEQPTQ